MRQIIEDNDLEVMAVNARYTCSYANIAKKAWWMKSKDCGPSKSPILRFAQIAPDSFPFSALGTPRTDYTPPPVVEQGTHFCDLAR